MLLRLFALFTIIPLVELAGLVWLSGKISLGATLALILATGLAGALLLRHQAWQTIRRVQADLAAGRVPADSLLDGLLMLIAGVLLISPGFVTDLAALAILFPPTRKLCKAYLAQRLAARVVLMGTPGGGHFHAAGPGGIRHDRVIEARIVHTDSPQTVSSCVLSETIATKAPDRAMPGTATARKE